MNAKRPLLRLLFRLFARRFVAGETLAEALPRLHALKAQDISTTLDYVGENVTDRDAARAATTAYIDLLGVLVREGLDVNISIKLSMLGLSIDEDLCRENLFKLLVAAVRCPDPNTFIRIDMEGSGFDPENPEEETPRTQATLDIFWEAYAHYPHAVGIVFQASLFRTEEDLTYAIVREARIRLCKGAYRETLQIAHQDSKTIHERYEAYLEKLFRKGARFPAIATHDPELIEQAKVLAATYGYPPYAFEFQMLYGIRRKEQIELARHGWNVRVYVPYGTHWLPYFSRRLGERKENVYFLLRHLFRG